jgi:hypothetical protein
MCQEPSLGLQKKIGGPFAPGANDDVQRGGGGSVRRNKWHAKPPFGEPEAPANKTVFTDHFGLVSDVLAECFSRLQWSASSLLARFEVLDWWISALFKYRVDPLHDEVVDFAPLMEGGLAQRFVHRFGQVKAGMDADLNDQLLALQQFALDGVVHVHELVVVGQIALEKIVDLAMISSRCALSFS